MQKCSMQETICLDALIDKMLRQEKYISHPHDNSFIAKTINYVMSIPMATAEYVSQRREKLKCTKLF